MLHRKGRPGCTSARHVTCCLLANAGVGSSDQHRLPIKTRLAATRPPSYPSPQCKKAFVRGKCAFIYNTVLTFLSKSFFLSMQNQMSHTLWVLWSMLTYSAIRYVL